MNDQGFQGRVDVKDICWYGRSHIKNGLVTLVCCVDEIILRVGTLYLLDEALGWNSPWLYVLAGTIALIRIAQKFLNNARQWQDIEVGSWKPLNCGSRESTPIRPSSSSPSPSSSPPSSPSSSCGSGGEGSNG